MAKAMAMAKAADFMGLVSTDGIRYDCAGLVLMLLCFGAFVRHLRKRDVADDVQNRRPEGFQMQDYKAEKREGERIDDRLLCTENGGNGFLFSTKALWASILP